MSRQFLVIFLSSFVTLIKCQESDMPQEFLDAKSPMESQFFLHIIENNFPGLYDNVFAGIEARIAGGESTVVEKFPYQALMYMVDRNGSNFICGGSLITHEWVLTAAHCLYDFNSIAVFVGVTDRVNGPSVWSGNVTSRDQLVIHPQYTPNGHSNDIGLIRLVGIERDILDHKDVETIALPTAEEVNIELTGRKATVSGYGSTSDTKKPSSTLRFVTMPIISNQECSRVFGSFIRSTNLCMSGRGGKSVCSGDSGGPLVVEFPSGELVQVGIVSFGHKHGCTLGHPGVFTRVSSYLTWIEGHVGKISREAKSPVEVTTPDSANQFLLSNFVIFMAILMRFAI